MQATIFMSESNIIRALRTNVRSICCVLCCSYCVVLYRVYAFELSLLPIVMILLATNASLSFFSFLPVMLDFLDIESIVIDLWLYYPMMVIPLAAWDNPMIYIIRRRRGFWGPTAPKNRGVGVSNTLFLLDLGSKWWRQPLFITPSQFSQIQIVWLSE